MLLWGACSIIPRRRGGIALPTPPFDFDRRMVLDDLPGPCPLGPVRLALVHSRDLGRLRPLIPAAAPTMPEAVPLHKPGLGSRPRSGPAAQLGDAGLQLASCA